MLPCNFNHLYYFYRVAVHKSVSKASKELLIAQSALSTQLKQLEESFETTLFNRTKGGMDLTESGDLLYTYASKMFETFDEMKRAMVLAEFVSDPSVSTFSPASSPNTTRNIQTFRSTWGFTAPTASWRSSRTIRRISLLSHGTGSIRFSSRPS
jgi:DNA-binding transcriptional LysR family regulator